MVNSDDIFEDAIRRQVLVATEEADLILFLVDVTTGLTDWAEDVASILRRTKRPVILVANKTDNNSQIYDAAVRQVGDSRGRHPALRCRGSSERRKEQSDKRLHRRGP